MSQKSVLPLPESYSSLSDGAEAMLEALERIRRAQRWLSLANDQGCGTPKNYKIEELIAQEVFKIQNSIAVLDEIIKGIDRNYEYEQTINYLGE